MADNELNGHDRSLGGGQQQPNNGYDEQQQQAHFAPQQSQHGERQRFPAGGQQRQYGVQRFFLVPVQQMQGGQVGASTQQPYGPGGQPSRSSHYATAAQEDEPQTSSHRTVFPSGGQRQQYNLAVRQASSVFAEDSVTAEQAAGSPSSQHFLQVPGTNRIPSGESSNSYTSGLSSTGSFVQQVLPRRRLEGSPSQMTGQQQSLPYAPEYENVQRLHLIEQVPLVQPHGLTPRNTSQQLSPTAAQFHPGVQQHSVSGRSSVDSQHVQDTRQLSTGTQIFHPAAPQSQRSFQQHLTYSQQNTNWSQSEVTEPIAQGRLDQGPRTSSQGAETLHQAAQSNQHSLSTQADPGAQSFGVSQRALGVGCEFLDNLTDEKKLGVEDADALTEEQGDLRQRALDRTEQWLDQSHIEYPHVGSVQTPEGLQEDPLYQETLREVQEWQRKENFTMTDDQQTELATAETLRKKGNIKGGKRLAEMYDSDIGEGEIAEAAQNTKRQRTQEAHRFWDTAHKVYAQVPENRYRQSDGLGLSDDEEGDGLGLDATLLGRPAEFVGKTSGLALSVVDRYQKPYEHKIFDANFRLLDSICCDWEFMIEVTKHLRVEDLITLYSISKTFHGLVNLRFQSTIAAWAQEMSPAGHKIFYYKLYGDLCITDPARKVWANPGPVEIPRPPWAAPQRATSKSHQVRDVPGFQWLAMVAQRETRTRDILACLARSGHRLPRTMHVTLKKIWALMDAPTNRLRWAMIHNKDMWTDRDLYNAQMFFIKLQLRFNEPIFGPRSTALADTFLGVRDGLNLMWQMFRKRESFNGEEAVRMRLRYYCRESIIQHCLLVGVPYFGLHPSELVNEHLEGWGAGKVHLFRPDELVRAESIHRGGRLEKHTIFMMFWGHVDWEERVNLVPTEEEMDMSDDELPPLPTTGPYATGAMWGKCGNVPFNSDNWLPKHVIKARWEALTRAEKLAIMRDDAKERVMALAYEIPDEKFWELPYNSNDMPHPDYPGGEPPREEEEEPEAQSEDGDGDVMMDDADNNAGDLGDEAYLDDGSVNIEYEYAYEDEPLPMPDTIEDPEIIAAWADMDPYLQHTLIDEENRLQKQDDKDERTMAVEHKKEQDKLERAAAAAAAAARASSAQHGGDPSHSASGASPGYESPPSPYISPMKKRPKRYRYPSITDPVSLALLERYDRFAPGEFRTDADGKILRGGDKEASSTDVAVPGGYDDLDDEDLKALGDLDYDSEDDINIDMYQKFLGRVEEDGGAKKGNGACAEDDAKGKKDVKGEGEALPVESSSSSGDEEDYSDMMVHEEDLDEDGGPRPSYEFRKF
ncbi:unnamed protein product [Discula destructiva]